MATGSVTTLTTIELQSIEAPLSQRGANVTAVDVPVLGQEQLDNSIDSECPDGGYGWLVVLGCSTLAWWLTGLAYCWGVLQAKLVDEGVSTPSTLAFVGSLTVGCVSIFAILNAGIIRRVGSRPIALLGITLLGTGQLLTGFATRNVAGLFLTNGLLTGIGQSLCFMVVWVTPSQYFKAKRGIANGIVSTAGGVGGTVLSFALNSLVEKVGPAWTFRIIGFAVLGTGIPAACLVKERIPIRTTAMIEWRLFQDMRFVLLFLASGLAIFPLFVPPFFLPLYSRALGFTSGTAAALVAAFNFSSACGRLLCGFAGDRIGALNSLVITMSLTALSMLVLWPFADVLGSLIAFAVINGLSNGGFFATMPTVIGNTFGTARVSIIMGMMITGWGAGYLFGAPIAGYILNTYQGPGKAFKHIDAYHPAIYYAGSVALVALSLAVFLRFKLEKRLLKRL